jgi:hypothetical protein
MKGVTYIRVKLQPQAECQRRDCGWGLIASRGTNALGVRACAEKHVQETGHIVFVTISDVTQYSPERQPEVTA